MLNGQSGNDESKTNRVSHEYFETEMKYGCFKVRPGCMQIMLKPLMCVLVLAGCCSTQVMLQHMLPAVELTLKMQYRLDTKDINGLNIARGISLMVSVILLGYFGNFNSKMRVRLIAIGMAVSGFGAILFAIPHFRTEKYAPLDFPKMALMQFGTCGRSSFPCVGDGVESSHMTTFVFGQIFIGLGLAPLFSLVPAYIDENVNPRWMPVAMTLWYAVLALGPVTGFAGAAIFQAVYIDVDQPKLLHQLEPEDLRWRGAWWLGFIVFGAVTMVNAIVVAGFPGSLPGAKSRRHEHMLKGYIPANDDRIRVTPSGLLRATTTLLKNKAFLFNTLANICIVFFLYAMGPFIVQMLFIKYGADPFKVIMPVIIVLISGLAVGVVLGGYLTHRISLKSLATKAAFLCFVTQAVCILGPLVFVVPGCNESNIAGVTKEYPAMGGLAMPKMRVNTTSEITAACNNNCKCGTALSEPVCGSNNVAYFDPCHAGCQFKITETDYINCTCIPSNIPGIFGSAKKGFCDRGCASWKIFLLVAFLAVVILGANVVPSRVVVLRCVQNNQRSYALAVQTFLYVLVAFIPTHLVTYIMHQDCHIWQTDPCGRKGICWDYDTNSMSKSMTIFGLLVTALATTFYFFAWYTYDSPRTMKLNRLLSDTSAAPDDDDGKETKL